jgi:hypothetical protein
MLLNYLTGTGFSFPKGINLNMHFLERNKPNNPTNLLSQLLITIKRFNILILNYPFKKKKHLLFEVYRNRFLEN